MQSRHVALATSLALLAGLGCSKKVTEPAPVSGGEFLTYAFTGGAAYSGTIKIGADGDGFTLTPEPAGGYAVENVAADIADGRSQIKAFHLGRLWLPPSLRAVGTKTPVGNVSKTQTLGKWPVLVVEEHGGSSGKRFFHRDTGFLVGMQISVGGSGLIATLTDTNIAGH